MRTDERVELYKKLFPDCKAVKPVKELIENEHFYERVGLDALEGIRDLNTLLSELYNVPVPVLTVWVRDDNYVSATKEIYLGEPELEGFLHQFRHHLQNIERDPNRRGITVEGHMESTSIPYKDTLYNLYGEDDAIAWAKMVLDLAVGYVPEDEQEEDLEEEILSKDDIGYKIKCARKEADISQRELADRIGLGRTTVVGIENGYIALSLEHAKNICKVLKMDWNTFC